MKFISVCSGIEAASVAWSPLGWEAVAFSEIEPFPCSLLAHHYPNTPNWGDMTKYKDWPDVSIDLLCGGTPCQSFSVAGLRKGLDDPRGNLMLTFGAIAAKYRPQWLVWENVPGVLSANEGRDFASFLGLITGQEITVPVGGWQNSGIISGINSAYGVAYRVLDAQYFGVAQRRRRVFVVGCLGDWRSAAAVLFERHSLSGHPAPSRKTGQKITPTIRAGAANGGAGHGARSGDSKDELIVPVSPTLRAGGNKTGGDRPPGTDVDTCETLIPVRTLCVATDHAGAVLQMSVGITIHGTDKTERVASYTDVAGCLRARTPGSQENSSTTVVMQQPVQTLCVATGQAGAEIGADMAPTLSCNHEAPYAVIPEVYTTLRGSTLRIDSNGTDTLLPVIVGALCKNTYSGGMGGRPESAVAGHVLPVAASFKGGQGSAAGGIGFDERVSPTLSAADSGSNRTPVVMTNIMSALPINDMATRHAGTDGSGNHAGKGHGLGIGSEVDPMFTLTKGDKHSVAYSTKLHNTTSSQAGKVYEKYTVGLDCNSPPPALLTAMQVRRLTPRECERLMGFQWLCAPDYPGAWQDESGRWWSPDYTAIIVRGKPAADGPRYKSLGNSWAVPVAAWVGKRITEVTALQQHGECLEVSK